MGRSDTKLYSDGKNMKLAGLKNIIPKKASGMSSQIQSYTDEDEILDQQSTQVAGNFGLSEISYSKDHKHDKTKDIKQDKTRDLRQDYIDNYGIQMEFPAYYYHSARFVPHVENAILSMSYHITPKSYQHTVQTTYQDGTVTETGFDEIYKNIGQSVILKLQIAQGRKGFKLVHEVQLKDVRKAILEVSETGQWVAIFIKQVNILKIFDSQDIYKCMWNIEKDEPNYRMEFGVDKFEKANRVVFDKRNKYVAVVSATKIIIISLKAGQIGKTIQEYTINLDAYQTILDVKFDSYNSKDGSPYNCVIACKVFSMTSIHIFDINDDQAFRSIAYIKKKCEKDIVVKISDDFEKVIFSNGVEHYMLNKKAQDNFPWIKDKLLRNVINHGKDFYFVTSKDYDRDIDILHSEEKSFNASFKRSIEPGSLFVYDSIITGCGDESHSKKTSKHQGFMKTIMKIGQYLYLDVIDISKSYKQETGNDEDEHISMSIDKHYTAFAFNWPYFTYSTIQKKVIILNSFNPTFIQIYELPKNTQGILSTCLTDTVDMFIIVETEDENHAIYHLNLDSKDPRIEGPIFQYPFSKVNSEILVGFHVRASSVKEKINLNEALICYMLHGTDLWSWTDNKQDQLELISNNASNLYYLSDKEIFFMKTEKIEIQGKKIEQSTVYMIESMFGNYKKTAIYQDIDKRAEILNFGVDNQQRRLIILSGIKNQKNKRDKYITLYDIDKEIIIYQLIIKSREIIGRLKSNLYNFTQGHIYYGNKVIKIRYDLLSKMNEIKENQLFDHYSDVLRLDKNDFIQSGTPFQTCLYNRLAYLSRNIKDLKPRKLIILPYLHERRIYLNRRHNTNQFYTLFEHEGKNYIICLCISDNKMYVYTQTGTLIVRIIYDKEGQWGKPVATSENGQYFIFKKSDLSPDIFIVKISIMELTLCKQINIPQAIQNYMSKLKDHDCKMHNQMKEFYTEYLCKCDPEQIKNIELQFCLNDSGDVLVRLKPKAEYLKKLQKLEKKKEVEQKEFDEDNDQPKKIIKEKLQDCSFFYYVANQLGKNSENIEHIYHDSIDDSIIGLRGVSMNEEYKFFWNAGSIWKLCLKTKILTKLSLYISEEEKQTFIKRVRTGSNKDVICVRVEQSPTQDCLILWDLENDLEISSFDVDTDALFFQDSKGNFYLAEKNYVINCNQKCKLLCYDIKVTDFNMENASFKGQYGHRVDTESHNFMIFRNFINLSFSYMTFVIKDNFEKRGHQLEDFIFDKEGIDYVLFKNTIFTEGNLVTQQYEKLQFILKNYYELDPNLLESLHYRTKEGKTPLHLALKSKNTRMVNLILTYMAKIDDSNSGVLLIKDIFKDLINFQSFESYLLEVPFQTVQMVNKQTLVIKKQDDDEIVAIKGSRTSYVDEDFFKSQLGEQPDNPDFQTFAVKFHCIRADWIINDKCEDGLNFLKEMIKQKNKDIFMTNYMKIITQFLYKQYSIRIIWMLLPFYVIHLVAILAYLAFAENLREISYQVSTVDWAEQMLTYEHDHSQHPLIITRDYLEHGKNVMCIIAGLVSSLLLGLFVIQTKHLGVMSLTRVWSIIDILIIALNICVVSTIFVEINTIKMRIIEAILILLMWFKSLYFLALIPEISPLIAIIFVIFRDMRYFLAIFIIAEIAFMNAFYIIGRNQLEESRDPSNTYTDPSYSTWLGAAHHVYTSSMGEFDTGDYFGNPMTPFVLILFLLLSFFMCIHLMNMLIAIMGESFSNNNQVAESSKRLQQLKFVVDNWWINPIKNKEQIVFLCAAFSIDLEDDDQERFEEINKKMTTLTQINQDMMKELKRITNQVDQIATSSKQ